MCADAKPTDVIHSSISEVAHARSPGTDNARKCPTVEKIEQCAIRKSLLVKQPRN